MPVKDVLGAAACMHDHLLNGGQVPSPIQRGGAQHKHIHLTPWQPPIHLPSSQSPPAHLAQHAPSSFSSTAHRYSAAKEASTAIPKQPSSRPKMQSAER